MHSVFLVKSGVTSSLLTAEGVDINAQLAQAHELEAKLTEEYHAVRLLRASITEKPPRAANACVS
jgi:hypothetical protein